MFNNGEVFHETATLTGVSIPSTGSHQFAITCQTIVQPPSPSISTVRVSVHSSVMVSRMTVWYSNGFLLTGDADRLAPLEHQPTTR